VFATFEEFFHADFLRLIGFLIKLGYSEEVSEDAAIDAMVIVSRKWSSLESRGRGFARSLKIRPRGYERMRPGRPDHSEGGSG